MSYGEFEFPSSSYYRDDLRELLAMYKKVTGDYNELIDEVADLHKQFDELDKNVDEYVDRKIRSTVERLERDMEILNSDIKNLDEYVKRSVADMSELVVTQTNSTKKYVNDKIELMANIMDTQLETIRHNINELRIYTDSIVSALDRKTEKSIEELREFVYTFTVDQISVINPVTKKRETIQKTVDDLWDNLRVWRITAQQYDNCLFTAQEYDELHLTAKQFDDLGLWWLHEKRELVNLFKSISKHIDDKLMMSNPFTGTRESVVKVVQSLFSLLQFNTLKASEYDAMNLSASEYDAKNLTAYEYDWLGVNVLNVIRYRGLSADEYERLGINSNNFIVYN